MKIYRDLRVWEKAVQFASDVDVDIKAMKNMGILGDELIRNALNVPMTIAEAYSRRADKEIIVFLQSAQGALFRFQTCLDICLKQGLIDEEMHKSVLEESQEIERMLSAFIRSIRWKQSGNNNRKNHRDDRNDDSYSNDYHEPSDDGNMGDNESNDDFGTYN
ncbi:MAG: four helix bundle protein [Bacteroidales bacterium]